MIWNNSNIITENALIKKYFIQFHYVLLIVLLLNCILYYLEGNQLYNIFLLAFFCDLFAALVIYRLDYILIEPYVIPYLIIVFLFLCYFCSLTWSNSPTVLIFFTLFPLGTYTIFSKKIVIIWTVISCLTIIMIVFVFKNTFTIPQTKGNSHFNSSKIIISYALIFGFIFYYNSILIKSKYTHIIQKEENDFEDSLLSDEENLEGGFDEKKIIFYNELYQQIENYFKINTPWKDSNFNIQVLAHNIQSNTTYISRAINLNAGMNFKNFVNVYRVEFIKTEIQNNKNYRRYKLLYLYSKAGFKHQSTFNKAFKRITNMTPSDYIEFINKENTLNKD